MHQGETRIMSPEELATIRVDHPDLDTLFAMTRRLIADTGAGYVLQAAGNCMKLAGIWHGDYVAIRQQSAAEENDIVVAQRPRDRILKRLKIIGGRQFLVPDDPECPSVPVGDGVVIIGKAVGVLNLGGGNDDCKY
jgi:SOS-response transcriptional repressor LexA